MTRRTKFKIAGMDCPSEEQLVRMALQGRSGVGRLDFDLPARELTVLHDGEPGPLSKALETLDLGSVLLFTEIVSGEEASSPPLAAAQPAESAVLRTLLAINGTMFVLEAAFGWFADSTGLIADSLDMLGDSVVYGLSLYAVGHALSRQRRAARLSGWFQLLLAAGVLIEVVRRYFYGSDPQPPFMMAVSALALAANVTCLVLLHRHREGGVHMRASWIFSTNDVIANCGVIAAGLLVHITGSNLPDLVIGAIVGTIVMRGAFSILRMAAD